MVVGTAGGVILIWEGSFFDKLDCKIGAFSVLVLLKNKVDSFV